MKESGELDRRLCLLGGMVAAGLTWPFILGCLGPLKGIVLSGKNYSHGFVTLLSL